jgi:hypothetical protein
MSIAAIMALVPVSSAFAQVTDDRLNVLQAQLIQDQQTGESFLTAIVENTHDEMLVAKQVIVKVDADVAVDGMQPFVTKVTQAIAPEQTVTINYPLVDVTGQPLALQQDETVQVVITAVDAQKDIIKTTWDVPVVSETQVSIEQPVTLEQVQLIRDQQTDETFLTAVVENIADERIVAKLVTVQVDVNEDRAGVQPFVAKVAQAIQPDRTATIHYPLVDVTGQPMALPLDQPVTVAVTAITADKQLVKIAQEITPVEQLITQVEQPLALEQVELIRDDVTGESFLRVSVENVDDARIVAKVLTVEGIDVNPERAGMQPFVAKVAQAIQPTQTATIHYPVVDVNNVPMALPVDQPVTVAITAIDADKELVKIWEQTQVVPEAQASIEQPITFETAQIIEQQTGELFLTVSVDRSVESIVAKQAIVELDVDVVKAGMQPFVTKVTETQLTENTYNIDQITLVDKQGEALNVDVLQQDRVLAAITAIDTVDNEIVKVYELVQVEPVI